MGNDVAFGTNSTGVTISPRSCQVFCACLSRPVSTLLLVDAAFYAVGGIGSADLSSYRLDVLPYSVLAFAHLSPRLSQLVH